MLDIKTFLSGIESLEQNGISKEITIKALSETFETIVKKKHIDGLPDAIVKVNIVPEEGKIDIVNIKKVVEEVTDDEIEVSLEDAKEIDPNAEIGNDLEIKIELEQFTKAEAMRFKSVFKQKIKEAEKAAVMQLYSDKVGELITGHVEKVESRYTLVNINNKTSAVLPDKEKIGDEKFEIGQAIKVYLASVGANNESGINISRACPGFLKRLFEEEIHDVFTGVVQIKDVARSAGERAKVSVFTNDFNVDPVGSCIGPGGSKIQKICSQINHEKIDIIQYHQHKGLFIVEALKPGNVIGVRLNDDGSAVAVVKDGDLRVSIGKKGVNAHLAGKLVGCKIDIKEESQAAELGIEYLSIPQMEKQEQDMILEAKRQNILMQMEKEAELRAAERAEREAREAEMAANGEAQVDAEETPVEEVKVEAKPVEKVEEKIEIKNTSKIDLNDLERQIEEEKKRKQVSQPSFNKKKNKSDEDESKPVIKLDKNNIPKMDIYTKEELEEMEEEYLDEDEDFDDYDEYADSYGYDYDEE